MNPVAEGLIRGIVAAGIASGTREGAMLAQLAAQALQASGLTSPDLPPSGPSLSPDARRMRAKRARQRAERAEHGEQNERVRTEGEGGGLGSFSGIHDLEHPKGGGVGEGTFGTFERSNAFGDSREQSHTRIRNATDDGAFGMTVDAWCAGVSKATGLPCTRPTHGQQRSLVECQQKHRPVTEEPVAWSEASAFEWASAHVGRSLTTFVYVAWMDSGKPAPFVPRSAPTIIDEAEERRKRREADEQWRLAELAKERAKRAREAG